MKVAVIGATGFVGAQILKELTDRQHEVKAFARDITKVPALATVEAIAMDVNDTDTLASNLQDIDVVVSAYNAGWINPNIYTDFIKGAKAIEAAVEKAGVKRLIVIGGAGSLQATADIQIVDTPEFPAAIKPGALAARDYLNILKENTVLDWTFFSPAPEMHQGTSGVRKGVYRLGTDFPVVDDDGRSILSVEDVAVVIADEVEQAKHIKQRFTAAY
ncbi:NAD(P)-dependent oxidoreductase [Sphingobacterium rhinopitheci]|uniref:NAD(P)-dependent oxidoreductase n=1 Tax=Sphingobacterium rhinopitheci TaxID=2781960 RepID=UPI001F51D21F|nr:NAD(P)H-binding protein [Sphingobacterium rhinopitheci]MCI0920947.1 NAD(P)H-binding protein [Sphingobacterium rhinopitheci]